MLQLIDMINRLTFIRLVHSRFFIECSQNIQTVGLKALVAHQRLTQLARTDQHRIGGVIIAQKLLDVIDQSFPQIANLRSAAIGYRRQILSHLHLAHAKGIGQSRGGNVRRAVFRHAFQISQISGQTLQHGLGDFFLFHRNPLSCIRYKMISIYFHIDYSTGDFHFQEIIMRRMSV